MLKKRNWIVLLLLAAGSVCAEMRMWTAEDGSRFTGEFSRELFGKIQIRDVKGDLRYLPIEKLTPAELSYIQTQTAPEFNITVRKRDRMRPELEWTIDGDRTTLYTLTVTLDKKRSLIDSKVPLTAELYVFGEEVDGENWVLLHREVSTFVFPEGDDSEHVFVAEDIPCRKYTTWDIFSERGVTYTGYLLVVLDSKGTIVKYKTDVGSAAFLKMGIPDAVEKLQTLYVNGRGSPFSRHFDEKIRKRSVPQLPYFERSSSW